MVTMAVTTGVFRMLGIRCASHHHSLVLTASPTTFNEIDMSLNSIHERPSWGYKKELKIGFTFRELFFCGTEKKLAKRKLYPKIRKIYFMHLFFKFDDNPQDGSLFHWPDLSKGSPITIHLHLPCRIFAILAIIPSVTTTRIIWEMIWIRSSPLNPAHP